MSADIAIVLNPTAGRGGIRAKVPALLEIFRAYDITNVYETSAEGEEEALAVRAIDAGATTIVAVGGDGTCSRIADVIIRTRSACILAVVPAGTGNDFATTLGVEKFQPEQIAKLVSRGRSTRIDVG